MIEYIQSNGLVRIPRIYRNTFNQWEYIKNIFSIYSVHIQYTFSQKEYISIYSVHIQSKRIHSINEKTSKSAENIFSQREYILLMRRYPKALRIHSFDEDTLSQWKLMCA